MKSLTVLRAIALIVLIDLCSPAAARVVLRPLSPSELKRALLEAGGQGSARSPNVRSIPSALAGITGFALGVTNGIGGALLYDVATSNGTLAYVTNLINNLNTNVISTGGGGGGSGTVGGGTNNNVGTIQEVCFNGGSLTSENSNSRINEEEKINNDYGDFYDDEEEVEEDEEEENVDRQGRQANSPIYNGLTCVVVNTGEAILRHRRSVEIVKDSSVAPTVLLVQNAKK